MYRALCILALLPLLACGPGGPGSPSPGAGRAVEDRGPSSPKTITVAALNSIRGFGPWNLGTTGGGAASLGEIHSNGLVTNDFHGNLEPCLAARLPSFEDGTIVVLPDVRMRATWELRASVKWHAGAPFTADDVVAGWQISSHPEIPTPASTATSQNGDGLFRVFDSRLSATPQNRYQGRNRGNYANRGLDRPIDRLYGTIDEREQGLIPKEMGEIMAIDLPAMPVYFGVSLAAVRAGMRALTDDFAGTTRPGLISRNAHLWDRL